MAGFVVSGVGARMGETAVGRSKLDLRWCYDAGCDEVCTGAM